MRMILCSDDLPIAPQPDVLNIVMSFEGGRPLEGRIENLRTFFCLGLRSMQITWNLRNELADGVKEERTRGGLTNFGQEVVREMDRLGMVIDLAHISRAGWFDVLEVASGPVCCTHSNCRKVYHHFRTIDDDQIKALAQTGGVLGVNAIATMVDKQPTLDRLVDHICHIADLSALTTSALVSISSRMTVRSIPRTRSFGVGENRLIPNFENEDDLPNMTECLIKRGFNEHEIMKILGGNFLRLLSAVLKPRSHLSALGLPVPGVRQKSVRVRRRLTESITLAAFQGRDAYVHKIEVCNLSCCGERSHDSAAMLRHKSIPRDPLRWWWPLLQAASPTE